MGIYDHKQVILDYAKGNILANCMKPKRLLISADMNCEVRLTILKL